MRKKGVERDYDLVARTVGRALLWELLTDIHIPQSPAIAFAPRELIERKFDAGPVVIFFMYCMNSTYDRPNYQFIESRFAHSSFQVIVTCDHESGFADNSYLSIVYPMVAAPGLPEWRLETGEALILAKAVSRNPSTPPKKPRGK